MDTPIRQALIDLLGPDGFSDAPEDRLTYAYDATDKSYPPDGVVIPTTVDQVAEIMRIAQRHGVAVTPMGAATGYTGGALAVEGGLVLVMTRFNRILEIDAANQLAVVEPGVITGDLHKTVEDRGLFYPPDPASTDYCTIGGNIAENAGGMRAVKYGVTRDYVMGLEVVLPSGEVIHTGSKCIKDVVGYDLTNLFVGSEGTLGVITKAIVKLQPLPESRGTLLALFPSLQSAARTVPAIIAEGIVPATLEFMDHYCIDALNTHGDAGLPPSAKALLLIEVDGFAAEIERLTQAVQKVCRDNAAVQVQVAQTEARRQKLWQLRRMITAALSHLPLRGDGDDIVVPRSRIPEIVEQMAEITPPFGLNAISFGHAGDGNIHVSLAEIAGRVSRQQVRDARAAILKAAVALEGRIAAEHGIGVTKREKIAWNLDPATLNLMRQVKAVVDPRHLLNPGKLFPAATPSAAASGNAE